MAMNAVKLKEQGNNSFKQGDYAQAVDFYAKAEKADSNDHVYPSNLSAAFYELGDYAGCVDSVIRAFERTNGKADVKADFLIRLSTRLARALSHGTRSGAITRERLSEVLPQIQLCKERSMQSPSASGAAAANDALTKAWDEWTSAYSEMEANVKERDACLAGLSRLPLFCKPLDQTKEYYKMGMDEIIDLTEGWGPDNRSKLKLDQMPLTHLQNLSFLFGGVGDARHVLGTICGLHLAYKGLSKARQNKFHAHLTLLDIHDATLLRDLCLIMLLHELNSATDTTARIEIKSTLMYMYCGVVMPSYCYDRLHANLQDLRRRLRATPPDFPPWLHVVSDSIPALLPVLDFWINSHKSARMMLAHHESTVPFEGAGMSLESILSNSNSNYRETIQTNLASERQRIKDYLLGMSDADLARLGLAAPGASASGARSFIEQNMEMLVDGFQRMAFEGTTTYEAVWYKDFKVFFPPSELVQRHPGFEIAWKQVKSTAGITPAARLKAMKHIADNWKPNITLFDLSLSKPEFFSDGDGYPELRFDIFTTVNQINSFASRNKPKKSRPSAKGEMDLAWSACDAFFEETARALKALGSKITLEFICGGLSEELAKMRFHGDLTRPASFPRNYTRMWLSNVPDYTHGPMNEVLYVIPNLQDSSDAAAASNSLLNTGAWDGDKEFIHTYTLLLPDELPRLLACRVIDCRPVIEVLVLGSKSHPRPLSELASRAELTTWLTRVLFNTFFPGESKPVPCKIYLPHNLVAFFGLLMYLHRIGYPAHWLSDFLARVLSGRMLADVVPYTGLYPIPVSEHARRVSPRGVRTDPWLVEFETIIATAYHAIPFPVALPGPESPAPLAGFGGFSRDPSDIAMWQARVRRTLWMGGSPYSPTTHLMFYRSDVMSAGGAIGGVRAVFEGRESPTPGKFFILTAQEHVQYQESIRFKLSKKRVERMRKEKWSMVAYCNDSGEEATYPVSIENWTLYPEHGPQ